MWWLSPWSSDVTHGQPKRHRHSADQDGEEQGVLGAAPVDGERRRAGDQEGDGRGVGQEQRRGQQDQDAAVHQSDGLRLRRDQPPDLKQKDRQEREYQIVRERRLLMDRQEQADEQREQGGRQRSDNQSRIARQRSPQALPQHGLQDHQHGIGDHQRECGRTDRGNPAGEIERIERRPGVDRIAGEVGVALAGHDRNGALPGGPAVGVEGDAAPVQQHVGEQGDQGSDQIGLHVGRRAKV